MDDVLSEFITETTESLDVIDVELVRFEQEPNNADILGNIFRLVHTIKGTCGFLGLTRLEALAHAAETLMGQYRDGSPVTPDGVSLILESIDRIKELVTELGSTQVEPEGSDNDLISLLEKMATGEVEAAPVVEEEEEAQPEPDHAPGRVPLDELERAFQEAPGPDDEAVGDDTASETPAEAEVEVVEEEPAAAVAAAPDADAGKTAAAAPKESTVKQSIRVNVDTLEHLMTMVSELVLTRNQLLEMVRALNDSEFKVPLQRLSNVTAELQEGVMKTRMQPIGNAWQKLPRIIRDLSKELDKKIDLEMVGAETELDRQVLELIKDPLTHMVRNSADHGLEDTAKRGEIGKPESGKVRLAAFHEGGHIIIEVSDDGRGLDAEVIKNKLVENGVATREELDKMSEQQIHKYIFNAGFSTAKVVTNVSGRGVGMDVVRTNIELIGGSVDVKSIWGKGTTFTIKIPLTLAIVSALIVEAGGQRYAIPQLSVVELVRTHSNADNRIEMINDTPVLRLRNKLLPLVALSKLLKLEDEPKPQSIETEVEAVEPVQSDEQEDQTVETEEKKAKAESLFVVVIQVGNQSFGIVVDSVFDTEEIVVKPMSNRLRDITMFSGNTILGDGSVIMIIDPNGLAQEVSSSVASQHDDEEEKEKADQPITDQTTAMLIFSAGSDEQKAVPLSLVTRLEEIDVSAIEKSNGRNLVQYRGSLMPLLPLSDDCVLKEEGQQPTLVFTDDRHSMGLVVDEIIDIVEDKLNIEIASDSDGLIGSAVIKGKATEIIDIGFYLGQIFNNWLEDKDAGQLQKASKLLLVDDSPFFRNMLHPLLAAAGYDVTLAGSAREAHDLREAGVQFDIIISDIEMPEMDGIEFAQSLRGDAAWGTIPIIALSSHGAPHVIERSRAAGFVDFVGKFDREGLLESLKDYSKDMGVAA
jgi:two-component system chemotaxis sensor kinase CheA